MRFYGTLNTLGKDAAETAAEKGFQPCDLRTFPIKMMLVVTEAAEAVEWARKGEWDRVPEELADILIRTLQAAHTMGYDMDKAVREKMEKNLSRPPLNGKKVTW